jgi:hypothetical protein
MDPAFALWQLNIDSGMVNYTLLMGQMVNNKENDMF